MKKLLDSDWLRAVLLKCNTSAKSVTSVQKVQHQCKLHIVILDYDWLKENRKFSKPHKMAMVFLQMSQSIGNITPLVSGNNI